MSRLMAGTHILAGHSPKAFEHYEFSVIIIKYMQGWALFIRSDTFYTVKVGATRPAGCGCCAGHHYLFFLLMCAGACQPQLWGHAQQLKHGGKLLFRVFLGLFSRSSIPYTLFRGSALLIRV